MSSRLRGNTTTRPLSDYSQFQHRSDRREKTRKSFAGWLAKNSRVEETGRFYSPVFFVDNTRFSRGYLSILLNKPRWSTPKRGRAIENFIRSTARPEGLEGRSAVIDVQPSCRTTGMWSRMNPPTELYYTIWENPVCKLFIIYGFVR